MTKKTKPFRAEDYEALHLLVHQLLSYSSTFELRPDNAELFLKQQYTAIANGMAEARAMEVSTDFTEKYNDAVKRYGAADAIPQAKQKELEEYIEVQEQTVKRYLNTELSVTPIFEQNTDTAALIIRQGDRVAVYFQPTVNTRQMGNNFTAGFTEERLAYNRPKINLHKGFTDKTLDVPQRPTEGRQPHDKDPTFQEKIEAVIHQEFKSAKAEGIPQDKMEIIVAGISRGGALAQIAGARWVARGELPVANVLSIGSPRVGDAAWVKEVQNLQEETGAAFWRYESGGDIVTELPPRWLGYADAGQHIYVPSELNAASLIVNPSQAYEDCDRALHQEHVAKSDWLAFMGEQINFHESGRFMEPYFSLYDTLSDKADRAMKEHQAHPGSGIDIARAVGILNGDDAEVLLELEKKATQCGIQIEEIEKDGVAVPYASVPTPSGRER